MGWIFAKNPMQMGLVQYKVRHMTFELTRIWICIAFYVIKHLEIGLNLENGLLSYSTWKLFIPLDGAYLLHLITLLIVAELALLLPCKMSCIDEEKNLESLKVHNVRAHHMFSHILQLRIYEFIFTKLYFFTFLRGKCFWLRSNYGKKC